MPEAFNQAKFIAERFAAKGYSLAAEIGVPDHQVADWRLRTKVIPEKRRQAVLTAAERLGVDVTPYDFIRHFVKLAG